MGSLFSVKKKTKNHYIDHAARGIFVIGEKQRKLKKEKYRAVKKLQVNAVHCHLERYIHRGALAVREGLRETSLSHSRLGFRKYQKSFCCRYVEEIRRMMCSRPEGRKTKDDASDGGE